MLTRAALKNPFAVFSICMIVSISFTLAGPTRLLEKTDIRAYTEIPKVHGVGEAGAAFGSLYVAWGQLHDPPGLAKGASRRDGEDF